MRNISLGRHKPNTTYLNTINKKITTKKIKTKIPTCKINKKTKNI